MPLVFPSHLTQRSYSWTNFKTILVQKGFMIQYDDDGTLYTIFGYDGPDVHMAAIWKSTVPDGIISGGYSQGQNDTDKTDFETNYKSNANMPIGVSTPSPASVDGYVSTSGNTFTAIMATAYTEQVSEAQRSLVSSSTNDTSAGTGARTVRVTYYDNSMNGPFTEDVTMNGTSAVNMVASNVRFIERLDVITAGSLLSNDGTISLKSTTNGGGSTVATIAVGDGETNWCHHYVGNGRKAKLFTVVGTIKGMSSGNVSARVSKPTVANTPESTIAPSIKVPPGMTETVLYDVPVEVRGPARIVLYAKSDASSGSMDWTAGFGYYEG